MMAEEIGVFSCADISANFCCFCRKFFFGNLLFTTKSGAEVQILQNDKKVDVCVEMRAELW